MKILVFTGAGSSVELGVPAMSQMARAFRRHVNEWRIEAEFVEKLMPSDCDIEDLIDKLDSICLATEPLRELVPSNEAFQQAETVKAEVEWYVQHNCERLSPELATLHWGPLMRTVSDHELVVATTNYDRAVELAANSLDVPITDGFDRFTSSEIATWKGLEERSGFGGVGSVTLLKLHGSTDWYQLDSTEKPVKLRHPMPLFGDASLRLPSIDDELRAALILPSREKRLNQAPFGRLNQVFLNASDECDIAIFLGTSLRDPHVRQAAIDSSDVRPTYVVNRSNSDRTSDSVRAISQSASCFLVSTLPAALASSDPEGALDKASNCSVNSGNSVTQEILPSIEVILDKAGPERDRCAAIEYLEELGVSLDKQTMETILGDSSNLVARFALGLIPLSPHSSDLIQIARTKPDTNEDVEYQDELEILERLLESQ